MNTVSELHPKLVGLRIVLHSTMLHHSIASKYQTLLIRAQKTQTREYQRGKYHCTVDLLFDWFGLVCFANKNKNCHLSYS